MARAQRTDYLQAFRFHLTDAGGDNKTQPALQGTIAGRPAGFQSISGLTISGEPEEIREGNYPFPHHVLSKGSVGTVTLSRGIVPEDSDFYLWFSAVLFGRGIGRRNLRLDILRRPNLNLSDDPTNRVGEDPQSAIGKSFLLHKCIPVSMSLYEGLDASSSDVLIASLDVQPEFVEELAVR